MADDTNGEVQVIQSLAIPAWILLLCFCALCKSTPHRCHNTDLAGTYTSHSFISFLLQLLNLLRKEEHYKSHCLTWIYKGSDRFMITYLLHTFFTLSHKGSNRPNKNPNLQLRCAGDTWDGLAIQYRHPWASLSMWSLAWSSASGCRGRRGRWTPPLFGSAVFCLWPSGKDTVNGIRWVWWCHVSVISEPHFTNGWFRKESAVKLD